MQNNHISSICAPDKPYFIHIRPELPGINSRGGITLAVVWAPESGSYVYEVAMCHPSENYNKKVGRAIAIGRLHKNGGIPLTEDITSVAEAEQWLRYCYRKPNVY